jgi:hypothetical protein
LFGDFQCTVSRLGGGPDSESDSETRRPGHRPSRADCQWNRPGAAWALGHRSPGLRPRRHRGRAHYVAWTSAECHQTRRGLAWPGAASGCQRPATSAAASAGTRPAAASPSRRPAHCGGAQRGGTGATCQCGALSMIAAVLHWHVVNAVSTLRLPYNAAH